VGNGLGGRGVMGGDAMGGQVEGADYLIRALEALRVRCHRQRREDGEGCHSVSLLWIPSSTVDEDCELLTI
jgi:hypothetical protein